MTVCTRPYIHTPTCTPTGQEDDAVQLHANFTAAWRAFGWMPEMFGVDLSRTDARDPGVEVWDMQERVV
eukprot:365911-Chlamydomonas_euryale.AAC.4